MSILNGQYHSCWSLGDGRSQCFRNHGIDLNIPWYTGFSSITIFQINPIGYLLWKATTNSQDDLPVLYLVTVQEKALLKIAVVNTHTMCAASTCPTFLHSTSRTALLVCNSYCSHVRSRLLKVIDTLLLFFTIRIFVSSCSSYRGIHWNKNVVILTKFSSLAALEVVILTTSSAASDEHFIKMKTFPFQCTLENVGGCHYHRNDSFFHKIHVYSLTSGWCSNKFKRAILKHFYHLLSWAILWYYPQVNTTLMPSLHWFRW